MNVDANDHTKAWDGMVDGVVVQGLYTVDLTVEALDGTIGAFTTQVCNHPCGLMGVGSVPSRTNCGYGHLGDCWFFDIGCNYLGLGECYE